MNDYFSSFNQSYHWFEALALCLTFLSPTLVKMIFFCIADNSKASHQCLMLAKGLERGHFRQLTHEKDSVLEEEASWGVHSPRVEAKTRNSASGSWRKKTTDKFLRDQHWASSKLCHSKERQLGFERNFAFPFSSNQIKLQSVAFISTMNVFCFCTMRN